jgi:hypothetical protein
MCWKVLFLSVSFCECDSSFINLVLQGGRFDPIEFFRQRGVELDAE